MEAAAPSESSAQLRRSVRPRVQTHSKAASFPAQQQSCAHQDCRGWAVRPGPKGRGPGEGLRVAATQLLYRPLGPQAAPFSALRAASGPSAGGLGLPSGQSLPGSSPLCLRQRRGSCSFPSLVRCPRGLPAFRAGSSPLVLAAWGPSSGQLGAVTLGGAPASGAPLVGSPKAAPGAGGCSFPVRCSLRPWCLFPLCTPAPGAAEKGFRRCGGGFGLARRASPPGSATSQNVESPNARRKCGKTGQTTTQTPETLSRALPASLSTLQPGCVNSPVNPPQLSVPKK